MNPFVKLSPPYSTIVADPPWRYDEVNPPNPLRPGTRPLTLAYSSMSVDEIAVLPVGTLAAADSRLFLWVTNRYLRESWRIVESWGFTPATRVFVWCKPPMGTANVTTEFILMGKRGSPPKLPWYNTTWFAWPRSRTHSKKPAAFLDLVESWSPGPYVELFARTPRLGWDSWGYGYEGQT